jgi:arylsulfatase
MAKSDKPNILFIMADDIGWFNVSCYNHGIMSFKYIDWFVEHIPIQFSAQAVLPEWLESFKEFPPRQKAASFTVDQIVEKLMPKS